MFRKFIIAAGAAALMASPSFAAPCKDAKTGKFIKCPTVVKTVKPAVKVKAGVTKTSTKTITTGRCRNAEGQFAKCGTPGAKPA